MSTTFKVMSHVRPAIIFIFSIKGNKIGDDTDQMTEDGRQFALDLTNYFEVRRMLLSTCIFNG